MLLTDTFSAALSGILANKSRSLLTMLGIIIGVSSVVLMTSIGGSVEGLILQQVSSLGPKNVFIAPGNESSGNRQFGIDTLTLDDIEAVSRLSTLDLVAPVILVDGQISYGREEVSHEVRGVTEDYFENQSVEVQEGRLLDDTDDRNSRSVAVLGPDTVSDLFGNQNPVGKRISIRGHSFTVVGVTEELGTQFFQNADESVYIPFSLAKVLSGRKYVSFVTASAMDDVSLAVEDIKSTLRQRHQIENREDDPKKDDFTVRTAEQAFDILGTVTLALTAFLSAIAGISLVVGGIGIMNIMLVVVSERTREIGLRKAVGARRRDILLQFLLEAVLLTVLGGIIGVAIGLSLAGLAALIIPRFIGEYAFALSLPAVFLALAMAAGTGLVFGIHPALRAARLNPIEALRYE